MPIFTNANLATSQNLGDGNPTGTIMGKSVTEKIAFYGDTPIVRATVTLGAGTTTTLLKADVLAIATALDNLGLITSA